MVLFEYNPTDMNDLIRAAIAKRLRAVPGSSPTSSTSSNPSSTSSASSNPTSTSLPPPAQSTRSRRRPSDSSATDPYSANDSDDRETLRRSSRRKGKDRRTANNTDARRQQPFDATSSGLPSPPAESPVHRPVTPVDSVILEADSVNLLAIPPAAVSVSEFEVCPAAETIPLQTTPKSSPKILAAALPEIPSGDCQDIINITNADAESAAQTIPAPEPSTSSSTSAQSDSRSSDSGSEESEFTLTEEQILERIEELKKEKHELFALFKKLMSESNKDKDNTETLDARESENNSANTREEGRPGETIDNKEQLSTAGQLDGKELGGIARDKTIDFPISPSSPIRSPTTPTKPSPTTSSATTTFAPAPAPSPPSPPPYRTTVLPTPTSSKPITSPFANQIPAGPPASSMKRPRSPSPSPICPSAKSFKFGDSFSRGMYFAPARPFGPYRGRARGSYFAGARAHLTRPHQAGPPPYMRSSSAGAAVQSRSGIPGRLVGSGDRRPSRF